MPDISLADPWALLAIALALALGGILKGATGAGMPVIAVPVIASIFGVQLAVAVLVIPNLIVNLWQMFKYRGDGSGAKFALHFSLAGAFGAGIGTYVLATLPTAALDLSMAAIIFAYIFLRLLNPEFRIPFDRARRIVWAAGAGGGILQGAVGISAPVAVTFANAIRLERSAFIFLLSAFFFTMCLVQIPMQVAFGIMDWTVALLGLFALAPLLAALPVGEWIGSRMSTVMFDRCILAFLAILAVKQIVTTLIAA